jgi:chromosome segregation ATPase
MAAASDHRARDGDRARLAAQNADLLRRVQQLSPVLAELARDLAGARRESAALRRENEQLRSRLTSLEWRTAETLRFDGRRRAGSRARGIGASTSLPQLATRVPTAPRRAAASSS